MQPFHHVASLVHHTVKIYLSIEPQEREEHEPLRRRPTMRCTPLAKHTRVELTMHYAAACHAGGHAIPGK